MRVCAFEPALSQAWNGFNRRARNGHFLFDRGYMDYHADRFTDASLVVLDGDEVVALTPANRQGGVIHSHQGLTFGGLVVDGLRTTEVCEALDLCAAHWRDGGAERLVYKPLPWIYHRRPAQEDLYWLFRRDARLTARLATAVVATDRTIPPAQRRRRGAAKAAREGLVFACSDRFEDFWAVLEATLADRHGARPVHSSEEIRRLAGRFPDQIELHTAELGRQILAGAVLFRTPQVLHTQYIAASPEGRAMGALDGLFLALMEQARGHAFFDFGTSNEDGGRILNEGLIRQKEEFGASVAVHDVYELSLGGDKTPSGSG